MESISTSLSLLVINEKVHGTSIELLNLCSLQFYRAMWSISTPLHVFLTTGRDLLTIFQPSYLCSKLRVGNCGVYIDSFARIRDYVQGSISINTRILDYYNVHCPFTDIHDNVLGSVEYLPLYMCS